MSSFLLKLGLLIMFSSIGDKVICYRNLTLYRDCWVAMRLFFYIWCQTWIEKARSKVVESKNKLGTINTNVSHRIEWNLSVCCFWTLWCRYPSETRTLVLELITHKPGPIEKTKEGVMEGKGVEAQLQCDTTKWVLKSETTGMSH